MNFTLRPISMHDLDSLVKYANNENVSAFMTDQFPFPYTIEAGKTFISRYDSKEPAQILVIEIDEELGGVIGIHPQDDIMKMNAELGYWVAEPFWDKGIATEAVKQMVDYAFETFDINRIFARPFGNNKASQRVLEKAGFKLEARIEKNILKRGEVLDELVYALRRS